MTIQRMDHVGIVVEDLAAATEFFVELGLEVQGEGAVRAVWWTDRLCYVRGPEGIIVELAQPID